MRAAVAMAGGCALLLAGAVISAATHAPGILSWVMLVLIAPCAVIAFGLARASAAKSRIENAEAIARTEVRRGRKPADPGSKH
jgi:predicted nicotinamide N-methyase